jgi:L-serine/L-threonine ammonia-lyase
LSGILLGLKINGWSSVPVIAAETIGAESFNLAMEKGKPTVLAGGITSIAKSLGSTIASSTAVQLSKAHPGKVYPVKVTDKAATDACLKFADQQRCLVEPACGAALAAGAYDPKGIRSALEGIISKDKRSVHDVVVIACGGNSVNREMLEKWRTDFGL